MRLTNRSTSWLAIFGVAAVTLSSIAATVSSDQDENPSTQSFTLDSPRWVAFTSDGKALAWLIGGHNDLRLLDLETGKVGEPIVNHWATSFAFSPDGKQVASTGEAVILWDVATGERLFQIDVVSPALPMFSPDGKRLYLIGPDGIDVTVWDLNTRERLTRLWGTHRFGYHLAISEDGKRLAASGRGEVIVWDTETFERTHAIPVNGGNHHLTFRPGADELVIAGPGPLPLRRGKDWEEAVWVWDLNEDQARGSWDFAHWLLRPDDTHGLVVMPDGNTALVNFDGLVHVIDLETIRSRGTVLVGVSGPLVLSPDGEQLTSWQGGWVRVWKTQELLEAEPLSPEEIDRRLGLPPRPMRRNP